MYVDFVWVGKFCLVDGTENCTPCGTCICRVITTHDDVSRDSAYYFQWLCNQTDFFRAVSIVFNASGALCWKNTVLWVPLLWLSMCKTNRSFCSICKKVFPTDHLLSLHLAEAHDSFFAAQAARNMNVVSAHHMLLVCHKYVRRRSQFIWLSNKARAFIVMYLSPEWILLAA